MKYKLRIIKSVKFLVPVMILYFAYYFTMVDYVLPFGSRRSTRVQVASAYQKMFRNVELDYLVIGDSTAYYGIDPDYLPGYSFSISQTASTTYSNYKSLIQLENVKIKKGIIITQSFIEDHYKFDVWGLYIPNKALDLNDTLNIFCGERRDHCFSWEKAFYSLKYYQSKFLLNPYTLRLLYEWGEMGFPQYEGIFYGFLESITIHKGFFNKNNTAPTRDLFLAPYNLNFNRAIPSFPVSEIEYFKKIIEYAKEHNIKLYYVMLPTAASIYQLSLDEYEKSLFNIIGPLQSDHFEIVNMRGVEGEFVREDFWDFNHLNSNGVRKLKKHLNSIFVN